MALHPGEAGYEERIEEKSKVEERRQGCIDLYPRDRRGDIRMSDIVRAVDKVLPDKSCDVKSPGLLGDIKPSSKELLEINKKKAEDTSGAQTQPLSCSFDKNSPSSLKQLRWEIYDLIERHDAEYGRTISVLLRSEVESLFKKYTHS